MASTIRRTTAGETVSESDYAVTMHRLMMSESERKSE